MTPRLVLEGTVQGQRSGATGATGGASNGPEHAPTIPRGVAPNRFTSVTSMVCQIAPTSNTPPVFGIVFHCPDSKHPSCVRGRVPCRPTECASVRCHCSGHYIMEPPINYNIDCRRPNQVGSYRPRIRPFSLLAVRLRRQLSVGISGRLLDRKA